MFHVDSFLAWKETTPRPDREDVVARRRWKNKLICLQDAMRVEWASYYDLKDTWSRHWRRLLNKINPDPGRVSVPPGSDHTSMWNRKVKIGYGRQPSEVLVTQPYGWEHNLDEMKNFADEHGLCFWISEQPAWHSPGRVCHIEWSRPDSDFGSKRNTREAHEMHRTTFSYGT
jgi:hypothetical protein